MYEIDIQEPLIVSIKCLAYNHEPYIRQCLEGFIMQKTNFRFEAIVHDDASTDGTAAIIREYAEKYPEIIKPIFETENQYSKDDGSLGKIMNANMHGKYIAMCEGDDYWTDPYKLQKQVDFLESHPDYSMCFHNAIIHYENSTKEDEIFALFNNGEFKRTDFLEKWLNPTASFVLKKTVFDSELYKKCLYSKKLLAGDLPLTLAASYVGKIYGFCEPMSIYRKQSRGIMNTWSDKSYELCIHLIEIYKIFNKDLHPILKKRIASYSKNAILYILHRQFVKGFMFLGITIKYAPLDTIRMLISLPSIMRRKYNSSNQND